MSVMSETFGYVEVCEKSHEFLRRACSIAPIEVEWAGDLLITKETLLKQSEINDMRGGAADVSHVYNTVECGEVETSIPGQYKVEETPIRDGAENSFKYLIPKAENPEDETNWVLDILQSLDECGEMMDGGDALQVHSLEHRVTSLCGTIDRSSGVAEPQAHYLDNRNSFSADLDNGLLVAIRTGAVHSWELRYAPKELSLNAGLSESDDITLAFKEALAKEGIAEESIIGFGMI